MIFASNLICRKGKSTKSIKKMKEEKEKAWTFKEYAIVIGMVAAVFASVDGIEKRFFRKEEEDVIKITISIPKESCEGDFTVTYTKDSYIYECEVVDKDNPVIIKRVEK